MSETKPHWIEKVIERFAPSSAATSRLAFLLYDRAQKEETSAPYEEQIRLGANVNGKRLHPRYKEKVSMLCLALYRPHGMRCLVSHGAVADHTLINTLMHIVSAKDERPMFSQTIRAINANYQEMALVALENGLSPKTDHAKIREILNQVVPDRTSFKHPERRVEDIFTRHFPKVLARLDSLMNANTLEKTTHQVHSHRHSKRPRL